MKYLLCHVLSLIGLSALQVFFGSSVYSSLVLKTWVDHNAERSLGVMAIRWVLEVL